MSGNLRCIRGTSNEMYINEKENNKKDQKKFEKYSNMLAYISIIFVFRNIKRSMCEDYLNTKI